jgi:hypothetical protein
MAHKRKGKQNQKLKELHTKLKKWCDEQGDEELVDLLEELYATLDAGDDEDDDGSNPPGGPGTPP